MECLCRARIVLLPIVSVRGVFLFVCFLTHAKYTHNAKASLMCSAIKRLQYNTVQQSYNHVSEHANIKKRRSIFSKARCIDQPMHLYCLTNIYKFVYKKCLCVHYIYLQVFTPFTFGHSRLSSLSHCSCARANLHFKRKSARRGGG